MAKKEYKSARDLPIYTACDKLVRNSFYIMRGMDRDFKHTLGQAYVMDTRDLRRRVIKIWNHPEDRDNSLNEFLDIANELAQDLKTFAEEGLITQKLYVSTMPLTTNIIRQANGWFKQAQQNTSQSPDETGACIQ